ncbi:hypothetical protein EP7_004293 [Isosphaeraceae bacterium EP7]
MSLRLLIQTLRTNPDQLTTFGAVANDLEKQIACSAVTPEQAQYMSGVAIGVAAHSKTLTDHAIAELDRVLREHVREELAKLRAEMLPHIAQ